MPGRHNAGGCRCCACGCSKTTSPTTWTVVLASIANNNCYTCNDYNGTYTLSRIVDDNCQWKQDISCSCCCPYEATIKDEINLTIERLADHTLRLWVTLYFTSQFYCIDSDGRCTYTWMGGLTNAYALTGNTCSSTYNCGCAQWLYIPYEGNVIERTCTQGACANMGTTANWMLVLPDKNCKVTDLNIPYNAAGTQTCDFSSSTCLITANGPYL